MPRFALFNDVYVSRVKHFMLAMQLTDRLRRIRRPN